ncbi:MAG: transposase [Chloroflexota bacterium]|nr:transposase [Chloroflexota bacterium]MEA3458287.1 transposase [Candidatus Thermoplasmatota archaeon]
MMATPKIVYPHDYQLYTHEEDNCLHCGELLALRPFLQSIKIVQTLSETIPMLHQAKQCRNPICHGQDIVWMSAQWQQIAPHNVSYGYDVIAQIGWWRQQEKQQFQQIHQRLLPQVQVSESNVRRLYYKSYLPLLACHERTSYAKLEAVAHRTGLVLQTDGLAPEGGEAQLWFVRELQTGLCLRSGWLGKQDEQTFINFLQPIADLNLPVAFILSDKQRGLVPAIAHVFTKEKHAYCQAHYLNNLAEPIADKDSEMKVSLRKMVRKEIGEIIREEEVEAPGVLTVTGLVASPIQDESKLSVEPTPKAEIKADCISTGSGDANSNAEIEIIKKSAPANLAMEEEDGSSAMVDTATMADEAVTTRQEIVQDILRRVRFLLTLKGRPPFRLAGLEMYRGLQELVVVLDKMLAHYPDATLVTIHQSLSSALKHFSTDFQLLGQVELWLHQIATILDPDLNPPRDGATVKQELTNFLDNIIATEDGWLTEIKQHLLKKTKSYASGLFHTYDNLALPRTNNDIESAFRDVQRRLLSTTGQKGLTKRLLHRYGAWELLSCPDTLPKLTQALSNISYPEWKEERQRFELHQQRFRMHTRSPKRSKKQLDKLVERWCSLE